MEKINCCWKPEIPPWNLVTSVNVSKMLKGHHCLLLPALAKVYKVQLQTYKCEQACWQARVSRICTIRKARVHTNVSIQSDALSNACTLMQILIFMNTLQPSRQT